MRYPLPLLVVVMFSGPVAADDWPQWMGPNRDDVWDETDVVEAFPAEGLAFRWRRSINGGFSGPAVADGRVYVTDYLRTMGDASPKPTLRNELEGRERVLCLDARTGDELWSHEYDCPYTISYPAGPRCTPTVDGDRVYTLGAMGYLFCLEAGTGEVVWSSNLPESYEAPDPLWGFAGHPLVHGDHLICTVGGRGSGVVAFDKRTGKEVWRALDAKIGYAPPTLLEAGGVTQLLVFHAEGLTSLDPASGEVHWFEPLKTNFGMAIMAPRRDGDFLFVGGHNGKSMGLQLDRTTPSVKRVWEGSRNTGLAPVSGTPFTRDGVAYGIDGDGIFRAVRIDTGERLWGTTKPVNGRDGDRRGPKEGATFVTRIGDRFLIFGENGDLVLARLSPERYEELSRTRLLDPVGLGLGRRIVWSHPAYADGCVFARNDREIVCARLVAE